MGRFGCVSLSSFTCVSAWPASLVLSENSCSGVCIPNAVVEPSLPLQHPEDGADKGNRRQNEWWFVAIVSEVEDGPEKAVSECQGAEKSNREGRERAGPQQGDQK